MYTVIYTFKSNSRPHTIYIYSHSIREMKMILYGGNSQSERQLYNWKDGLAVIACLYTMKPCKIIQIVLHLTCKCAKSQQCISYAVVCMFACPSAFRLCIHMQTNVPAENISQSRIGRPHYKRVIKLRLEIMKVNNMLTKVILCSAV